MKVARITLCTLFFTEFCTFRTKKLPELRNLTLNPKRKAAAEKSPNRAGATLYKRVAPAQLSLLP